MARVKIPIANIHPLIDYSSMDEDLFIAGLRRVFEADPSLKPATVSSAAGLDKSTIRMMFEGRAKSPKVSTSISIAKALGLSIEQIIAQASDDAPALALRQIAVPGRAGAGAQVHLIDDHAKGTGLYMVECPAQLTPNGIVAVEVEGDSMEPVYSQGDLLFYSRDALGVPTEAINRKCVCEDEDGRIWVKQVKAGSEPGLFNLLSINPTGANLHNIRLKWAAPVRLHLPQEFVRKV